MEKFCHHSMAATMINAIKTPATVNISSDQLNDCGTEINVILAALKVLSCLALLISVQYIKIPLHQPQGT